MGCDCFNLLLSLRELRKPKCPGAESAEAFPETESVGWSCFKLSQSLRELHKLTCPQAASVDWSCFKSLQSPNEFHKLACPEMESAKSLKAAWEPCSGESQEAVTMTLKVEGTA